MQPILNQKGSTEGHKKDLWASAQTRACTSVLICVQSHINMYVTHTQTGWLVFFCFVVLTQILK